MGMGDWESCTLAPYSMNSQYPWTSKDYFLGYGMVIGGMVVG